MIFAFQAIDYVKNSVADFTAIGAVIAEVLGILIILGVSGFSTRPFDGVVHWLAAIFICFQASFVLLGIAYTIVVLQANDHDHHLAVVGAFALALQGCAIGYVQAGCIAGVSQAHKVDYHMNGAAAVKPATVVTTTGEPVAKAAEPAAAGTAAAAGQVVVGPNGERFVLVAE